MRRSEALVYRHKIENAATHLSDEEALQSVELFAKWEKDINVIVGERRQYLGVLYEVKQSHRTQADWTPDITPALWKVVSLEEWPEWVPPTGAQDAYRIDAKVSHNEKHWINTIDYNTYEPGVYGWDEA
jgi:hypothetical protein